MVIIISGSAVATLIWPLISDERHGRCRGVTLLACLVLSARPHRSLAPASHAFLSKLRWMVVRACVAGAVGRASSSCSFWMSLEKAKQELNLGYEKNYEGKMLCIWLPLAMHGLVCTYITCQHASHNIIPAIATINNCAQCSSWRDVGGCFLASIGYGGEASQLLLGGGMKY